MDKLIEAVKGGDADLVTLALTVIFEMGPEWWDENVPVFEDSRFHSDGSKKIRMSQSGAEVIEGNVVYIRNGFGMLIVNELVFFKDIREYQWFGTYEKEYIEDGEKLRLRRF